MKMTDIRKASEKELDKKIEQTRTKLAVLKRERFTNDEKNVNLASSLKRDLARMLTEVSERNLAVDEQEPKETDNV